VELPVNASGKTSKVELRQIIQAHEVDSALLLSAPCPSRPE
jgi:hypothetical protein